MMEEKDNMLDIVDSNEGTPNNGNGMYDSTLVGDVLRGLTSPEGRNMCKDFSAFLEKWLVVIPSALECVLITHRSILSFICYCIG
jgi:hypothetical protein